MHHIKPNTSFSLYGALLHLILIGVPHRFGLLPTGIFQKTLSLEPPCSIFEHTIDEIVVQQQCDSLEEFSIREFGYQFTIHFELSIVACFIINAACSDTGVKDKKLRHFNMILVMISSITLLTLACVQNYAEARLETHLFSRIVLYHLLAIFLSWRVVRMGFNFQPLPSYSWSIPGFSILIGAVSCFIPKNNCDLRVIKVKIS